MRVLPGWLLLGSLCAAANAAMAEPAEPYRVPDGLPRPAILGELHQPAWSGTYRGGGRVDAFHRLQPTYYAAYLVFYNKHDRANTVIQSNAKDIVRRVGDWIQCGKRYSANPAKTEARCTPLIEPLYRAQRVRDAAEAIQSADHYRKAGNHERAELSYERALAATEELHGADSPPVADVLKEYAAFLRQVGETADAASMESRVQEILSREREGKAPAGE